MVTTNNSFKKVVLAGIIALIFPMLIIFSFSSDVPNEKFVAKAVSFDGYLLNVETTNGDTVSTVLHNIYITDTQKSWNAFNNILLNALVEVEVYGVDEEGRYLVELNVDGYDFDKFVLEEGYAVINP